ncbi:hypothetical protein ACFLTE_03225 [Bacteroidota bacterium]
MKKILTYNIYPNPLKHVLKLVLIVSILFMSCDRMGEDGDPGKAYMAISFYNIEPSFIDVGNTDIPQTFYYDEYYRVTPGWYTLYYEIKYIESFITITHAYEVDYEIWINVGERGDINYDGRDGADTYFTVELYPDGPEFWEDENYKSTSVAGDLYMPMEIGEEIKVIKTENLYNMKITYRKVKPRN